MITSENNAKLKEMIKLQKNARHRKKEGLFVAEGIKLVQEAAKYGKLRQVLIRESLWITKWQEKPENEIAVEFSGKERHVGVDVVPDDLFDQVADTVTPQGILGMVDMPVYSLEEILNSRPRLYLMLDDLRDPGNLGTMVRTGEGAGITGVIMNRTTVDLFNPKTIRSTMGSIYRVPYVIADDFVATLQELKAKGVSLYAAHLKGKKQYDAFDYTEPTGFMIGNEGNGLSDEVAEAADTYIRIPMEGRVESLNAAISASLLMYECNRQRRKMHEDLV